MFQLDIVTLFPEIFNLTLNKGVIGRAIKNDLIEIREWNPRDFTKDKHKTVDARPYGGGPGMVMMYEPVCAAINKAKEKHKNSKVIFLTPQGKQLNQAAVVEFSKLDGMILVCGRYEGIDERIIESKIDEEWSIGDYVLSGGEFATLVLIDSVCRLLPGVLGGKNSANEDSFVDGLFDYPHYTRPEEINGRLVPNVLKSGDHEEIRRWRLKHALGKTWRARPDLIESIKLNDEQKMLLQEYIEEFENL
ncbi:MAG: tRNA (guanosine(37)-N1)-methyltransferase TrmD [Pseudomonadota bacterium]|jgi:tRNA (guanine37-N1)-methyltransferase|nr:tRNA (guanosine(37)-N1)-methyltransferase TrmD [Pseudomonadota bacterium]|tara:strand:- start:2011 stop:2754 length:744 start_codon:yes stop_codon:yes gene_type:complete